MAVKIPGNPHTEFSKLIRDCLEKINNELLKSGGKDENIDIYTVKHCGEVIAEICNVYSGSQTIGGKMFELDAKIRAYRKLIFEINDDLNIFQYEFNEQLTNIINKTNKIDIELAEIERNYAGKRDKKHYEQKVNDLILKLKDAE